ncbi:amino acid--[acyl-carrier-protein] ligase [Undibacterium rugosum]|uniref:amino acid--[acyl-carrier-protein] ligase n=1 Tax=Undibacterium rugosum TaxID=2762291 RepID=UPI001B81EB1C|nr:amino acid--[acyl-carrier-protein] ligase [Undibacterium rugosum]MBR7779154.1 amino acid--[acyl-carrier-protein] ligase [Undibacterium rugosum]
MSIDFSPEVLSNDLIAAGHIIPVGVQGIFGRGPVFEEVLRRFDDYVSRVAAGDQATRMSFPPCLDRKVLERSEYLDSFPQLAGTIFSFTGNEAQHKELIENVHEGRPWTHLQTMTGVCLTPAACYPVYPSFTGTLPDGGRLVDMQNWVFRNEPSPEPTRMQSFRVREFVRVGTPDMVVAWRDLWLQRGIDILQSLGLPAHSEVASDPFFGRGGRMLAANQREQQLKFEVVIPVISQEKPTAVCSFNYHQDHFGKLFDIQTADGEVAHTACLGFGLERIVMALFKTHGMDTAGWPAATREILGL